MLTGPLLFAVIINGNRKNHIDDCVCAGDRSLTGQPHGTFSNDISNNFEDIARKT